MHDVEMREVVEPHIIGVGRRNVYSLNGSGHAGLDWWDCHPSSDVVAFTKAQCVRHVQESPNSCGIGRLFTSRLPRPSRITCGCKVVAVARASVPPVVTPTMTTSSR